MNKLTRDERVQVLKCLVDGVSIRGTCRITGVAKATVLKLLLDVGRACAEDMDVRMVNLRCQRIQCDEIWSFVHAKEKNVPDEKRGEFGYGSVWTWTAIDADTKLVPTWLVGPRNARAADDFVEDVAARLAPSLMPQVTTDGLKLYVTAVDAAFGARVDFAQLVKLYGNEGAPIEAHRRYSPSECTGTKVEVVIGNPDPDHISTSYVERANLTMRMSMRRFTRLTNGFSKKLENHAAALALYFWHYNLARPHMSLSKGKDKCTPAMAAGVSNRVETLADAVLLLEAKEETAAQVAGRRKDRRSN